MGPMVVVVVLPLLELVGEDPGVVEDYPFEQAVELFRVDAVRASTLPLSLGVRGLI